jgi:hypothetical protein
MHDEFVGTGNVLDGLRERLVLRGFLRVELSEAFDGIIQLLVQILLLLLLLFLVLNINQ